MKSKIILCTGGSRSGKSQFAERYTLARKGQKLYIATAQIYDDEMVERVARHQARRGSQWLNLEIPLNIAAQWEDVAAKADVILIDCLTMFVTNYLMKFPELEQAEVREKLRSVVLSEVENLLEKIKDSHDKKVVFVTNELGLGIVPADIMTRVFRDIAGEVNQIVAAAADEVYLSISGITIEIKSKEAKFNG